MTELKVIYRASTTNPINSELDTFFLIRVPKGDQVRATESLLDFYRDEGIVEYWLTETDSATEALNHFLEEI
jgi:hypothetical protein